MDEREVEEIVGNLVVFGGRARSDALEAVAAARKGDFAGAEGFLTSSGTALATAHDYQLKRIAAEMRSLSSEPVSLLMVHGQDYLMGATTTLDLAEQIVGLLRQLFASGALKPEDGKEGEVE